MGLTGFSGSGSQARLWRLHTSDSADTTSSDYALRLTDASALDATTVATSLQTLPVNPHLLPIGETVDVGQRRSATVLPLLVGASLAQRLESSGPLTCAECLAVAASMRDALDALHAAGLVHLDVSPANIVLTVDGVAVLCDTADVAVANGQVTRRGTPPYTVPGVDASPSTDWIALGRVVAELATGSPQTRPARLAETVRPVVEELLAGRDPIVALRSVSTSQRRLSVIPADQFVAPNQRQTIDFEVTPQRHGRDPQRRSSRGRTCRIVFAGAAIAAIVFVAAALFGGPLLGGGWRSPAESQPCAVGFDAQVPTGFEVIQVNREARSNGGRNIGDPTCTTPVLWSQSDGTLAVPTSAGLQRFAIGEPGDALSFGDWDCNGSITPALTRDDRFYIFADWPQDSPQAAVERSSETECSQSPIRRDG